MAGFQLDVRDISCPFLILRISFPLSTSKPIPLEDISRIMTIISMPSLVLSMSLPLWHSLSSGLRLNTHLVISPHSEHFIVFLLTLRSVQFLLVLQ